MEKNRSSLRSGASAVQVYSDGERAETRTLFCNDSAT